MASHTTDVGSLLDRFEKFRALDGERTELLKELLSQLCRVSTQYRESEDANRNSVTILEADLETEKIARRGLQSRVSDMVAVTKSIKDSQFVLVLIDADADEYIFREKYLTRGIAGGQEAATALMAKTREHLLSLGDEVEDANSVQVVAKAFANLGGLGQAFAKNTKLMSAESMGHFWIGFSRRFPMFDFVDVGSGKEEADNKIREVLSIHMQNTQCQKIMLGCCHDAGYAPVLRQYAATSSIANKINLISSGNIRPEINRLGLRSTSAFASLFRHGSLSPSPIPVEATPAWPRCSSVSAPKVPSTILQAAALKASPTVTGQQKKMFRKLGPVFRNLEGKRIDAKVDFDEKLANRLDKVDICHWHYLRADCAQEFCPRNHRALSRPLQDAEFAAILHLSRRGKCNKMKGGKGNCDDAMCIFGHKST